MRDNEGPRNSELPAAEDLRARALDALVVTGLGLYLCNQRLEHPTGDAPAFKRDGTDMWHAALSEILSRHPGVPDSNV